LPHLLGIIGTLVFFAGLDLLWQCRRDLALWVSSYMRMFRRLMREPESPAPAFSQANDAPKPRRTLAMFLGVSLTLVGPVLIGVSLALMLYPKL
jgi:hypothetical protein